MPICWRTSVVITNDVLPMKAILPFYSWATFMINSTRILQTYNGLSVIIIQLYWMDDKMYGNQICCLFVVDMYVEDPIVRIDSKIDVHRHCVYFKQISYCEISHSSNHFHPFDLFFSFSRLLPLSRLIPLRWRMNEWHSSNLFFWDAL